VLGSSRGAEDYFVKALKLSRCKGGRASQYLNMDVQVPNEPFPDSFFNNISFAVYTFSGAGTLFCSEFTFIFNFINII
jgi:hypothetical protein